MKIAPTSVSTPEIDVVKASLRRREVGPSIVPVTSQLLDVDHNILIPSTEGTYTQDHNSDPALYPAVAEKQRDETDPSGMEMFDFIDPAGGHSCRQAGCHHGGGRLLPPQA